MGKLIIFTREKERKSEEVKRSRKVKSKSYYKVLMSTEIEDGDGGSSGDGEFYELGVPTMRVGSSINRGGERVKSPYEGPLYSTVVSFRDMVVTVGGRDSEFNPINEVAAFVLYSEPASRILLPPLLSPKASPIVIAVSSLLFVFSHKISELGIDEEDSCLDDLPLCQILDYDEIDNGWTQIELPLSFPPPRPPIYPNPLKSYSTFTYLIEAYAPCCFTDAVYISIKEVCCYRVEFSKQSSSSTWTISPNQLRFYGEAKRLGLSNSYIGLPKNPSKANGFCIYKLTYDTQDGDVFSFDELSYIPLFSMYSSFSNHLSNKFLIQPLSSNTICFINSRVASPYNGDADDEIDLTKGPHFITTELYKLPKDGDEDGDEVTTRKRKNKTENYNGMKLLGYTRYPNIMPLPDNWCFFE